MYRAKDQLRGVWYRSKLGEAQSNKKEMHIFKLDTLVGLSLSQYFPSSSHGMSAVPIKS